MPARDVDNCCLIVPGRFESLAQIADFVGAIVRDAGWNEDETFRVQMAVDEACSNIIEHAYGPDLQGNIQLTCSIAGQGDLVISIRDTGRPFDPTAVPKPPVGADVASLPEGGLGLHFMHKLMDDVIFRFEEKKGNELIMIKRRPK